MNKEEKKGISKDAIAGLQELVDVFNKIEISDPDACERPEIIVYNTKVAVCRLHAEDLRDYVIKLEKMYGVI